MESFIDSFMPEIPIDFQKYVPNPIEYIMMQRIVSKQFNFELNVVIEYNEKILLVNIYSGDLKLKDITNMDKENIENLLLSSKKQKESVKYIL